MVYLDNNATTQPATAVCQVMNQVQREDWANPSSVHRAGQAIRHRIELARQQLATLLGVQSAQLIFTSGGTESNNLALHGTLALAKQPALITTAIEHAAIREPVEATQKLGTTTQFVAVNTQGLVDVEDLLTRVQVVSQTHDVVFISIQWANNETGTIQPIERIAEDLQALRQTIKAEGRRCRLVFHTDATQAVGKIPIDLSNLPVDLLTFSAHKFHGPKGVGGLYLRSGVRLMPQQRGGPQERERRGGTENTSAIVGMGVAAELAHAFVNDIEKIAGQQALRDDFEKRITQQIEIASVNSGDPATPRLWNTSNIAFRHLEAEAILLGLSEKGIYASAGAACSSGSLEPSPVLLAMGIEEPVAHGSLRFSLSWDTTKTEIDQAIEATVSVVQRLARTMPLG